MQYGTWKCIVCKTEGEWFGSYTPDRVCDKCGSMIEITVNGRLLQEAKRVQDNFARYENE